MVVLELKRENNIFRESRIWKMKEMMEMIISIGELELEDIHLHQMCIRTNWIQNQIFPVSVRVFMFFFFFFCKYFQIRMYFFLPLSSQKRDPFLVRFFEGKKRNESKKMGILRHLYISFSFFPFLNKCIYLLYGCFERKILFLWERSVSLKKLED